MKKKTGWKTNRKIQRLNAGLAKLGWRYPVESYKQGTPLTMAVFDSEQLWANGGACIPTLAWIAEAQGRIFDSHWAYYCSGNADPYFDNHVAEQHYLTEIYYDARWLLIGRATQNLVHPIGALTQSSRHDSYIDTYRELLPCLKIRPTQAVILPQSYADDEPDFVFGERDYLRDVFQSSRSLSVPEKGNPKGNIYPLEPGDGGFSHPADDRYGFGRMQFYLWPEIYFRKALGFTDDVDPEILGELGIKKVVLFFTDAKKWEDAGFEVEIGDTAKKSDTLWRITNRILRRWKKEAQGLTYGMWQHRADPGHLGFFIRNRYFALYDPDWKTYLPKAVSIAKRLGNGHMLGGGISWNHQAFSMFAEAGGGLWHMPMFCGAPTVKRGMRYRFPKPEVAPWECEYSDAYLERCAEEGKIGVSLIWTITEPEYISMLPNMLDLHRALQCKCGFAIHSLPWIEYYPEWFQKMFTRLYAPYMEPLLYDTGLSEIFTFKRNKSLKLLSPQEFKGQFSFYLEMITDIMGKDYIPRGYHTAEPRDSTLTEPWRIETVKELGMKYAILGTNHKNPAKTLHKADGDFTTVHGVINAHNMMQGDPPLHPAIHDIEKSRQGPHALFSVRADTGSTFVLSNVISKGGAPSWPVEKITPPSWRVDIGGKKVAAHSGYNFANACWKIRYVAKGGKSGRLFSCKPHELVRYTRLIGP